MTDSSQPSRPPQVTTAVVISVTACVLAVVNLFDTRDELRGSSFGDALTEAQDRTGGGVGLSNDQLLSALQVLVFVSGALAAAAAVLAVYAWQRNRAAWIGFFVLAAPLALTLPVAGVLPVLLLASGATFLASRPARDWFAGREPAAAGPQVALSQEGPPGPPPERPQPPPYSGTFGGGASAVPPGASGDPQERPDPAPEGQSQPPAYGPWHGASPTQGPGQGPGQGSPQGYPGGGYGGGHLAQRPGQDPDRRPGTVTTACVLTWLATFLVAVMTALIALVVAADRTRFLDEFQRQADVANLDVTQDQILAITWTMIGIGLFWCLAAAGLAVAAFRRSRGGRIGLAISAAMTVLVSLLLILSFVAVVPLLLGLAVLVLLFTGGANDWYARRTPYPRPPSGGGSFGGPQAPYPPQEHPQQYPPQYPQSPQQYPTQHPDQPPPPGRAKPW